MFERTSLRQSMVGLASPTDVTTISQDERPTVKIVVRKPARNPFLLAAEVLLVLAILVATGLVHGIGMFKYPFYLGDEGIYMAQAWSVLTEGRFDPYTYTYGHAPLGWVQISVWAWLIGGFRTFGTAIETGRVMMLIFQIASTFLVYRIARIVSRNPLVATAACLLFAFSPYAIYLHRRVLLDNIITFWMLLSVLFLLAKRLTLNHVWLSAVMLGIAVLSKENAILLMPALAYLVFCRADKSNRWFATIGWLAVAGALVSMYVLYAMIKGELFPPGTLLGGTNDHVSLLASAGWQAGRERDGGLFDLGSKFWNMAFNWGRADPFFVIGGIVFAFISILLIRKHRVVGILGLCTILLWLFIVRGSLVLDFYLAPELPFMALNIALVFGVVADSLKSLILNFRLSSIKEALQPHSIAQRLQATFSFRKSRGSNAGVLALENPGYIVRRPKVGFFKSFTANLLFTALQVSMIGFTLLGIQAAFKSPAQGFLQNPGILWQGTDAVTSQREAILWTQTHIPRCSSVIIDPYMYTDLHELPGGKGGYQYAENYWQTELDPAIKTKLFKNDWRNIDYIVATPGLMFDTGLYKLQLVEAALQHASPIATFKAQYWQITIYQVRTGSLKAGFGCSGTK